MILLSLPYRGHFCEVSFWLKFSNHYTSKVFIIKINLGYTGKYVQRPAPTSVIHLYNFFIPFILSTSTNLIEPTSYVLAMSEARFDLSHWFLTVIWCANFVYIKFIFIVNFCMSWGYAAIRWVWVIFMTSRFRQYSLYLSWNQ